MDLFQIRKKYVATCFDLRMIVESDSDGWKAQVFQGEDGRRLHSAVRCNAKNAQLAAAEFAVARMTGAIDAATVRMMSENLPWAESW